MENSNYKRINFPTLIMQLIAMLAISAFMAACGDNGGGGTAGNVYANGQGFVQATQMGSVQSVNPMNSVSMALNVIVDSGVNNTYNTYNNGYYNNGYYNTGYYNNGYYNGSATTPISGTATNIAGYSNLGTNLNLYNGPVAFQGTMVVGTNWYDLYGSGCQVPPGTYTVDTITTGTMGSGGLMSTVRVVANPGNIIMEINGGMINGNRLVALPPGGIHVAQANGINCSPVFGGSFN
ncbi:hypothetical protein B9G69_011865 [Bdellovibrio sp. SKB1291214]|uniref:hypothetical protein n=1 Tax=Bdellovibrio sp. SKB1291214 TaxID=1732569 RepID=UPI000B51B7B7|nr:hypothetical protein [Bdellovibrio sp. SKB1291214]UYL07743.1 hypothetical protein B9G69_011865 [Bdellovibrio sp. SKB1291214]